MRAQLLPQVPAGRAHGAAHRHLDLSPRLQMHRAVGWWSFGGAMISRLLADLTELIVPFIDLIALIFIVLGTVEACIGIGKVIFIQGGEQQAARSVWMRYSRWLVAGLTFQLAADIIETSVAPSWDDIGQLGAIAVIRTFLDFFLARDQREVRELR